MVDQSLQLLRSAVEQYRAGDIKTASKLFEQVVQLDSANQQAWMGLAACTADISRKQQYLKQVVALGAATKVGKQAHDKLMQLSAPAAPVFPVTSDVPTTSDITQILTCILEEVQALRAEVSLLRSEVLSPPTPEPQPDDPPTSEPQPDDPPTPEPQPSVPRDEVSGIQRVTDLLAARGVTIESIREKDAADEVFNQLAMQLGKKYQQLSFFYTNLRRYLNNPSRRGYFNLSLDGRDQQEIATTTSFCNNLLKYAIVQKYHFDRKTKMLYLSPQMTGDIPSFFTGYWFERYVFKQVCNLLDADGMNYTALANVKVGFSGGDSFELDMLFLVENELLWVECKTGSFEEYIAKYTKHRRAMGIRKSCTLLVVLDLDQERAAALSSIHSLTFVGYDQLTEQISLALGDSDNFEDEEQLPNTDKSFALDKPPELFSLLNKVQLRPHPELRPMVLTATLEYVDAAPKPLLFRDVKAAMARQFQHISKSKLQHLLNAVVLGKCLLNDKGEVVHSFVDPFVKLVPNNADELENRCQRVYIQAIIRERPDFFTQDQHYLDFQKVVGCLPSRDMVEAVRVSSLP